MEIKYRGKRKDNCEWVYGFYLISDKKHYIIDCCGVTPTAIALNDDIGGFPGYHEVIPETVGQYTSFNDCKAGDGIYGGHYVRKYGLWGDEWKDEGVYSVVYYKGSPCLERGEEGGRLPLWWVDSGVGVRFEIIGNIHDNPNLLEKDND